jgi:predicted kinase
MDFTELKNLIKKESNILIVMVGVPLSGKSTIIKELKDYCNVISRDDIVMELSNTDVYSDSLQSVDQKKVNSILNTRLRIAGKSNENVIIDMTNFSPKRRKSHLRIFKDHKKIALVLKLLPFETLLERNEKRFKEEKKFVPEKVIAFMIENYKYPTKEEGFDYIIKA